MYSKKSRSPCQLSQTQGWHDEAHGETVWLLTWWSHLIHPSLSAQQPHLDLSVTCWKTEWIRGCWVRPDFNLFGPGLDGHSISLPSSDVPSFNCNQRGEWGEGWVGTERAEERQIIPSLSLSGTVCIFRVCLCCNRLDHKLGSIHPISGSISVSRRSSPTHTGHIN